MKRKAAIFCITILMIAVSVSAQKITDVKGWNNALWGMTESDLKELFKENITDTRKKNESRDGKTYTNLEIRNIVVDGVKLRVSFNMGISDNKLKQVRLSRVAMTESFDILEKSLTNQYGQPTSRDDSESSERIKRSVVWYFPSTKIELFFVQTKGELKGKFITILYSDGSFTTEVTDD
jgi:hypothetical protein